MRDLIKNILKEEEADKFKKGIDISIKLLKRFYPFVITWQYSENFDRDNYDDRTFDYNLLDIDVICDIQKTVEFYNSELTTYYKKNIDKILNHGFAYPISITNDSNKITSDIKYESYKKIKEDLNDIYGILPKDMIHIDNHKTIRKLNIDKFRFQ